MPQSTKNMLNQFASIGKQLSAKFNIISLTDTPNSYIGHSGNYLVVDDNQGGITFSGVEKIANDLTDYGFLDGLNGGGGGGSGTTSKFTNVDAIGVDTNGDNVNDINQIEINLNDGNRFITTEVVEFADWRIDLKGGSNNETFHFKLNFNNISNRSNPFIGFHHLPFYFGWNGDFSIRTAYSERNEHRWRDHINTWPKNILCGDFYINHKIRTYYLEFDASKITQTNNLSIAQDANGNKYVVPDFQDQNGIGIYNAPWQLKTDGNPIQPGNKIRLSTGQAGVEYIYIYDVNGTIDIQYFDKDFNFAQMDVNNLTITETTTYNNQTVVSKAIVETYEELNVLAEFRNDSAYITTILNNY